jgi:methionyl-tRNA formyltransferase
MDAGSGSGDIFSQREILISDQDDARTLYNKVIEMALSQIEEFLPALSSGSAQRVKHSPLQANTWCKRGKKDGVIDWRMSAQSICNPYVVWCEDFQSHTLVRISWSTEKRSKSGKLCSAAW